MPTLNWRTRERDLKAAANTEYRLLVEEETYSYGDSDTGNIIVQGDNLEALKALVPFYAGQVKCIYIDPPYNTGSAFEHYDDNLEHTTWLSMMYPRLELLKQFLREDGSLWITLDDTEVHYCKVITDEIFGRNNFIITIAWQKRTSPDMRATISDGHDQLLVYAKNKSSFKQSANKIQKTGEQAKQYKNPDNDPRGPWVSSDYTATGFRPNQMYKITTPGGKVFSPPEGVCWKNVEDVYLQLVVDNRIWFGKDGKGMPRRKTFLSESQEQTPWSWWPNNEVGHTQESKKEVVSLFGADDAFSTPKPERLIQRIIHISTNPGDYVLDSFLGSGTTAAVAHKMGRRYIGVEMGEQAKTHCAARLKKVIEGEQGGISEAAFWKGGGGFRFFTLGEAVFDREGRIKPDISFEHLAAHIYFTETKTPMNRHSSRKGRKKSPFLGIHDGTAYALLYNGILGDKTINGGNVLTHATLNHIMGDIDMAAKKAGAEFKYRQMVIYGEATRLTHVSLQFNNIIFKQTPYDVKVW
jgi:adenine-specific DNA-methyltransferase